MVKMGLGRGRLKRYFATAYRSLSRNNPVDVMYHGLRLRLHPSNNTIESKVLCSSRKREETELDAIAQFIRPEATFLDVGANMGYYALHAAHMGAMKVIAVEPNPQLLPRLRDNIHFNGFQNIISIQPYAVSDVSGTITLNIHGGDIGSSSMMPLGEAKISAISVEAITLAMLQDRMQVPRFNIIKVDVEGAEDRVLMGYLEWLADKKYYPELIILEENETLWKNDLLKYLTDRGYSSNVRTRGNVILYLQQGDAHGSTIIQ